MECGTSIRIKNNASLKKSKCPDCAANSKNIKKSCRWCGDTHNSSEDKLEVCNLYRLIPSLSKHFGFDNNTIGTARANSELLRIKNDLIKKYHIEEKSIPEITKEIGYDGDDRNFNKILNSLGIELRNFSESNTMAYKYNRMVPPKLSSHSAGYHETFEGNYVYYRSSYELDICKRLDTMKVKYKMEGFRIPYFDTQTNSERTAIPDFYIESLNLIIEIKGMFFYDKQNMEEKMKKYRELGYNTLLIMEGVGIAGNYLNNPTVIRLLEMDPIDGCKYSIDRYYKSLKSQSLE